MAKVLTTWLPEDQKFWAAEGKSVARRNLWISIPCLLLSFAVWMVCLLQKSMQICQLTI